MFPDIIIKINEVIDSRSFLTSCNCVKLLFQLRINQWRHVPRDVLRVHRGVGHAHVTSVHSCRCMCDRKYTLRGYESESNSAITPSTFRWTWPTICPAIRYGSHIYNTAHLRVNSPSSFPFRRDPPTRRDLIQVYLHLAGNTKYSCS